MKRDMKWMLFAMMIIVLYSCRKTIGGTQHAPADDLTEEQKHVAAVTKEAAAVLELVYHDGAALKEVNAAIFSGYYADQRVPLRDLLFPHQSPLYKNEKFKRLKVDTGIFRKRFCEIIVKWKHPLLSAELKDESRRMRSPSPAMLANDARLDLIKPSVLSVTKPVAIYFPYAENFDENTNGDSTISASRLAASLKPTLVYTDREGDAAPGRQPSYCSGIPYNTCYRNVTVDDSYAQKRPTHIVTVGATAIGEATSNVPRTDLVHRVYHGASRLVKQMDKLISFTGNGGGSEIKVCRINGYLRRTDEQITDFSGDMVTIYYTRGDISGRRWKRVFSVWDPNWNYQDIEQIYAVYEDDTKGTRTIDGSLTTTLTLPGKLGKAEGDIGFKVQIESQDDIITQRKIDRKSFLRDGLNNQGWGFYADTNDFLTVGRNWPIYDGGAVWQFSLPYRIY